MKRRKSFILGVTILIFILSFIYFALITPTIPFDGDDWRYIGTMRLPIPLWGVWNPTKILPETLMPICGYIAAFIIYPFSGNYVGAITITIALVIALFVAGMFYCFYLFVKKRLGLNWKEALISQIFFFLSFFLLFKKVNQESYSMFWAGDVTCSFNYLIPGLLNAIVILIILQTPNFTVRFIKLNSFKKGLFIIALYFALFSNTQLSIILATVCFIKFIEIIRNLVSRQLFSYTKVWNQAWFYIITLVIWLLTIVFDLHGARAQMVQGMNQSPFNTRLMITVNQFWQFIKLQNKYFLFAAIVIMVIAISRCILRKDSNIVLTSTVYSLVAMIISLVYLLLAYVQAGGTYATRPDAMWAVTFFFLLAINICLAYLIKSLIFLKVSGGWPLLVILFSLIAFNFDYQPLPPSNAAVDAKTKVAIDNYIINQIVKADRAGKASVVVRVPQDQENFNPKKTGTNWPHSFDMEKWMQNTLYIHHIIRSRIEIVFKPDRKINTRFYENKEKQQPIYPAE